MLPRQGVVRPDQGHQIPFVHDLARSLDKNDEDVERAAAQLDGAPILFEKSRDLGTAESIRTK
jgi:hypothetical protein